MRHSGTVDITLTPARQALQSVTFQSGEAGVRVSMQRRPGQWHRRDQACQITIVVTWKNGTAQTFQSGLRRGAAIDRTGAPRMTSVWELAFYANDGQGNSIPDPNLDHATVSVATCEGTGFAVPITVEVF